MSKFGARFRVGGGRGLLASWMPMSAIQSVQSGTVTIANGNASGTATITAVNLSRATLEFLGNSTTGAATQIRDEDAGITLTDTTTVTATRGGLVGTVVVSFRVTQWRPDVWRSIQRFQLTIANASATGTATLSSLSPTRTQLACLGRVSSTNVSDDMYGRFALTDQTTVTGTRIGTAGNLILYGEVREAW